MVRAMLPRRRRVPAVRLMRVPLPAPSSVMEDRVTVALGALMVNRGPVKPVARWKVTASYRWAVPVKVTVPEIRTVPPAAAFTALSRLL